MLLSDFLCLSLSLSLSLSRIVYISFCICRALTHAHTHTHKQTNTHTPWCNHVNLLVWILAALCVSIFDFVSFVQVSQLLNIYFVRELIYFNSLHELDVCVLLSKVRSLFIVTGANKMQSPIKYLRNIIVNKQCMFMVTNKFTIVSNYIYVFKKTRTVHWLLPKFAAAGVKTNT